MQLFSNKKLLTVLSNKTLLPTSLCTMILSICLAFEFCEKHKTCPINNGTIKSKYFKNVLLKFRRFQISLHVTVRYCCRCGIHCSSCPELLLSLDIKNDVKNYCPMLLVLPEPKLGCIQLMIATTSPTIAKPHVSGCFSWELSFCLVQLAFCIPL